MNRSHRPRRDLRARPRLEGLEDRKLMYATLGANWTYGERITYSFAPEGTSVGGIPNVLDQKMAARGFSSEDWKDQVRRAAAVWQAVAGINLAEVSDNGAPIGQYGYNQQGDPHIGDIRIFGVSLNPGALAQAYYPPPINGDSLAGDIIFNTDQSWEIDGSTYDLQTVAIHEFGHALGLDHSAIGQAVMYSGYTGTKQALNADDTGGIRSIYGPRQQDFLDANGANSSISTADAITPYIDASTGMLTLSGLEINANADNDHFKIQVPAVNNGRMSVRLQSDDLSSLSPKLWIYNSAGQFLASSSNPDSYGSTTTITISGAGVTAGKTFFIRVNAANTGPSGTGAYGLQVNFTTNPQGPIQPPNTTVPEQPDQGGGGGGLLRGRARGHGRGPKHDELLGLLSIGSMIGYGDELTIDGLHHGHDGHDDHDDGKPASGPREPAPSAFGTQVPVIVTPGAPGSVPDDAASTPARPRARARVLNARAIDAILKLRGLS